MSGRDKGGAGLGPEKSKTEDTHTPAVFLDYTFLFAFHLRTAYYLSSLAWSYMVVCQNDILNVLFLLFYLAWQVAEMMI
jgi:hypothetical protein